jgi:phospholipase/carboxylesterase
MTLALVLLLALSAPALAQETPYERAMREQRYEAAAGIAERQAADNARDAVAAFDLARARARAGQVEAAIDALVESARRGYAGIRSIDEDPHLAAARAHPRFGEARDAVVANAATRFERFRAAAERVEPAVVLPPGYDPRVPAPLILALHGSGGTGQQMVEAWQGVAAALGAMLVAPDALRPQPGTDGFSWTFRDEAEWLVLRTLERVRARHAVGPVVLTGFSQGANVAFALGHRYGDLFTGIVPVAGHYEDGLATIPGDAPRPSWALVIGDRDPWAGTYRDAERVFSAAGLRVRRTTVRGMGHAMPGGRAGEDLLRQAVEWTLAGTWQ